MLFFVGFIVGAFVFEPLIINYVYLSNVYLFYDLIDFLYEKQQKYSSLEIYWIKPYYSGRY